MNNYERIKQMTIDEMAEFLRKNFDEYEEHFGCADCTSYETHHYPSECEEEQCYWLKIGCSIKKWLLSEVEE